MRAGESGFEQDDSLSLQIVVHRAELVGRNQSTVGPVVLRGGGGADDGEGKESDRQAEHEETPGSSDHSA